ncbi:MAG: M23 family metallopeptidase [Acidimicrobiales bacterium]
MLTTAQTPPPTPTPSPRRTRPANLRGASRRSRRVRRPGAVLLAAAAAASALLLAPRPAQAAPAAAEIPPKLLAAYQRAAPTCPGLDWPVLAALGWSASRHGGGRFRASTGELRPALYGPALDGAGGRAAVRDPASPDGWARAAGLMQFLPSTWARWGRLAPGRPAGVKPSPQNAYDSVYAAAAYLCGDAGRIADLDRALATYTGSAAAVAPIKRKAVEYGAKLTAPPLRPANVTLRCPVDAPVSFTDDWGAPRSGGRSHEGTDLFAAHGAPIVAVESGVVDKVTDDNVGNGGVSLWVRGDSGDRYYFAHNSRNLVRLDQRVAAGERIAEVGNTGNAAATPPHLHFQLHPGGGEPVNPYPALSASCATNRR